MLAAIRVEESLGGGGGGGRRREYGVEVREGGRNEKGRERGG